MRAALTVLLLLPSIACAEIRPLWSYFPGFPLPGINGMALQDLDGDGLLEAVITGSPTGGFGAGPDVHLAVLDHGPTGFKIASLLPLAGTGFAGRILTVPLMPGAPPSVLMSQVEFDGTTSLVQYSGIPLREISRVPVETNFQARQVVDVDGDGELEVLGLRGNRSFSTEGTPKIIDLATGATEWTDAVSAIAIGAGQLDADPALEIVIGQAGAPGRVLDGATRQVEWTYLDGFNGWPVFGNFRGDNGSVQEFAIVGRDGPTRIFVAEPIYSPVAEIQTGEMRSHAVADVNADGHDDLIIGDRQGGIITGYSTVLGTTLFQYGSNTSGVSAIVIGEMNGSAGLELLHGAGLGSTGEDIVRVLDPMSGQIHFLEADERGPHSSVLLADLDSNMTRELVWASTESRSGYSGSTLMVLDASTGNELRRRENVLDPWGSNPGVSMATIDLENDGLLELVVGSGGYYDPEVAVLDGSTLADRWRVQIDEAGSYLTALVTMPFNADQVDDIVVATAQRIVVLDGSNGQELYRSDPFPMGWKTPLTVGDIDGDTQAEVAFAINQTVYILDPISGLTESHVMADNVLGLAIESSQAPCRMVITFSNRLEQRACTDSALLGTRLFEIEATFVGIPAGSDGPLVLSDGERVYRMQDDTITVQSIVFDNGLGERNRGVIVGGTDEIDVYIGGMHGVHHIELPVEVPMFVDGFEGTTL